MSTVALAVAIGGVSSLLHATKIFFEVFLSMA
jgi:hypothetical protein